MPLLPKRMTLEEFLDLPEGPPYFEFIDGETSRAPAPYFFHQEIIGNVFRVLDGHVQKVQSGKVLVSPIDVILCGDCFEPDFLYISKERLITIVTSKNIQGPPDLLVEVLSESTYRRDLIRKRDKYAAGGVTEYWVLDPEEQSLRQFLFAVNSVEPVAIYKSGAIFESPLFPGLRIPAADLFRR